MTPTSAEFLTAAYDDPATVVADALASGRRPIRTVGTDAPREYLMAAGFQPVRLSPGPARPTPRADAAMGTKGLGVRCRRLLEQILESTVPVLITAADAGQAQLFAVLRELARLGEETVPPIHMLDLVHIDRPAAATYNKARLASLGNWLEALGGQTPDEPALRQAIATTRHQVQAMGRIAALRREAQITGLDALKIAGASAILAPEDFLAALANVEGSAPLCAHRLFVTGTTHEDAALYALIESLGAVIVNEDHGWGILAAETPDDVGDPFDAVAAPLLRAPSVAVLADIKATRTAAALHAAHPVSVLHLTIDDDEAAPWDIAALCRAMPVDMPFMALKAPADGNDQTAQRIARFLGGIATEAPAPAKPKASASAKAAPRTQRSRKSLSSVADFSSYQRDWFASVRAQVAAGAPFAVVNANSPQEIFRALDIPFVVNQWWASIVAAKQQSRRYIGLLKERHYPANVESYSAQGLAAAFDDDADLAPWGGLPRPDFVQAVTSSDPTAKIFGEWALASGAEPFLYSRTVDPRMDIPVEWWEAMPTGWDTALETERLDLMTAELQEAIARLEAATGRTFPQDRFIEIMNLVNEQEDYYRRTRDLIARTVPAPIGIVDSMPATMVPQWHRGTTWARDAAKAFYEEVAARVEAGAAAVPGEKVRLMWVGRGMWSDMAFYQQWEESHGALFVWSMYLGLAADGYIRTIDGGRDPLRALAARFLTMGDELRMPSWAAPWHVHEAQTHFIDGAVALSDADPFVLRALERAGIPVLDLGIDNFNREGEDGGAIDASITAFIEGPAGAMATARRAAA